MELRPIKSESDYRSALQEVELLFDAAPGSPELDRLDILCTLVEAYEQANYPIDLPDPIEAIQYYMEARGWTRRELELCLGSRARVSEVLSKKRSLTLEMIRKLHKELGIPADILVQPYESVKTTA